MTDDEAINVLQPLIAAFNFNDDSVEQWIGWIAELQDQAAAHKAAQMLAKDATDRWVPGWRLFKESYDRWVRRLDDERAEAQKALMEGEYSRMSIPTYERGIQIAWENYVAECERQGKQPNREMFDAWMGAGREERRAKARSGPR